MDIPAFSTPEAMWGIEDLLMLALTLVSIALIPKALELRKASTNVIARGYYLFLMAAGVALSGVCLVSLVGGWRVGPASGASMLPTLPESSTLVVDSYAYGIRRPFGGWWRQPSVPVPGDVAMFHARIQGEDFLLAKRVVGIPGDRVEYKDGQLFINSVRLSGEAEGKGRYAGGVRVDNMPAYLPAAHFHVLSPQSGQSPLFFEGMVPEGHVFFVGDNWAESYDSRDFGPVPIKALRGKVRWAWSERSGWVRL